MAGVISISSDEDEAESTKKPRKKLKAKHVIDLDLEDDEINTNESNNETDVIIESDDDVLCFNKNITTKVSSTKNYIKQDLCNKDVENHFNDLDIKHNNNKASTSRSVPKIVFNNKDIEDITESDEDMISKPKSTVQNNIESNHLKDFSENNEEAGPSKQDDGNILKKSEKLQELISVCLSKIENEETRNLFKSKIPHCEKLCDKISDEYIESENFKLYLDEKIEESKESSLKAVSSFNDIYYHLKSKVHQQKSDVEITSKHQVIIAKLEHALRKVRKRIIQLEEEEVNFNDDEDSSYIKMHRYRERAVNLHKKICKYKNEDANANNVLYNRLDFSGSEYPEFNHAINKKFRNSSVFPSYYELERCMKKVITDKNMNLSEVKFKQEARECFKKLGKLLQKRRKRDLFNIHSHYLVTNDDPAYQDVELEAKLLASSKEAKSKIDDICEKYVKLQDKGENPVVSSDSDDSKRVSTEDENDCL